MHSEFEADSMPVMASLLEAVLINPRMYTLTGTYEEAICFYKGYIGGYAHAHPGSERVSEWNDFRKWLTEQLKVDTTEVFLTFRNRYENSRSAIDALLEQFRVFLKQTKGYTAPPL